MVSAIFTPQVVFSLSIACYRATEAFYFSVFSVCRIAFFVANFKFRLAISLAFFKLRSAFDVNSLAILLTAFFFRL